MFSSVLAFICGLDTKRRATLAKVAIFCPSVFLLGPIDPLEEVKLDLKTGETSYGMFVACVEVSF